jgi:hypothetical protein
MDDKTLDKSTVSLELADIQKRCAELIDDESADDVIELSLEIASDDDDQEQFCIER